MGTIVDGTSYTFVTDGVESTVRQARETTGGKDVGVAGGANVVQQAFKAGLVDELRLHLAPILLGSGTRLLDGLGDVELERTAVIDSAAVTHLTFRIVK
jgi:dihydrofolate reductase